MLMQNQWYPKGLLGKPSNIYIYRYYIYIITQFTKLQLHAVCKIADHFLRVFCREYPTNPVIWGYRPRKRCNFGSSNDWPNEPLRPPLPMLSNHLRLQERCCHTYSLLSGPGTRNLKNHGFRIRAGPLKWWNPEFYFWGKFHQFSPGPIKSSRKWITIILEKGWRGNDINSLEVFSDRLCPFMAASPEIH